jgi:hypothetical protein
MDWVAVIGAAAWAPQILSWVCQFFTKPKITLYLHPATQIGYTTFGPIFNVSFALLSEKKDATLNNFSVSIKHENGASYTFNWDGLSEDLSEIQNPLGPTMSIKKTYLPLVVRVLHSGVAQVFVRFQYESFKAKFREKLQPAEETFQNMKNTGKLKTEQDIDTLTLRPEFLAIEKLIHSEFIWVAGKYTVVFNFQSPSRFRYKKNKYTFSLSQDDVDELRKNMNNIKLDITENAKSVALQDYKAKEIPWIWRFPELGKK